MRSIDFNCDMGEGFGAWRAGPDSEIMPWITSANIACGGHAGDPNVMAETIRLAKAHGVAVGAHPGYPDLQGFGRRRMPIGPDELTRCILYQLGALWGVARGEGADLRHVKPHGALYSCAASDQAVAEAIVEAVWRFSPSLMLYCLPHSELERAGRERGLRTVAEGFADRAYQPNGLLTDRSVEGAVLTEPEIVAHQAVALARGAISSLDGTQLIINVETVCIHSDTPGASANARSVHQALAKAGFTLERMRDGAS